MEDKDSHGVMFSVPRYASLKCDDNGDSFKGLLHIKMNISTKLKAALMSIARNNSQLIGVFDCPVKEFIQKVMSQHYIISYGD